MQPIKSYMTTAEPALCKRTSDRSRLAMPGNSLLLTQRRTQLLPDK